MDKLGQEGMLPAIGLDMDKQDQQLATLLLGINTVVRPKPIIGTEAYNWGGGKGRLL